MKKSISLKVCCLDNIEFESECIMQNKKSISIMQPYYFPYIGYWQLIKATDIFVVFDDVNYINRGWINRNRILLNGNIKYFNMKLSGASQNKHINEIDIINGYKEKESAKSILHNAYRKADYYEENKQVIFDIIDSDAESIAEFNFILMKKLSEYLNINTQIIKSSDLNNNKDLKGTDKIIDICKMLGAETYINAIGGMELYKDSMFKGEGIELKFIKTNFEKCKYVQWGDEYIEGLSIIDVMMFNSRENVIKMLDYYQLVSNN